MDMLDLWICCAKIWEISLVIGEIVFFCIEFFFHESKPKQDISKSLADKCIDRDMLNPATSNIWGDFWDSGLQRSTKNQ